VIQIEIIVRNDLIYADIPVWSSIENKYLKARMLIDTGASVTAFSDTVLKRLVNYEDGKKTTVRTASGIVDVYELRLLKIRLGTIELENIKVHAHIHLDDFHFDGIIGMNVLSMFNFIINLDGNILSLEKREEY
jgi:predicted aspartyl protease